MHGSSFLYIPEALKYFTLGIEYHHIHHFRTRIPGYMLRAVHEGAPAGLWQGVAYLEPRHMWRSVFLQIWDDVDTQNYATFNEVMDREWARTRVTSLEVTANRNGKVPSREEAYPVGAGAARGRSPDLAPSKAKVA